MLCCETIPMRRYGNVQRNTRAILVKLAQTALGLGKILLCGELHPIKGDGLIFRHPKRVHVLLRQKLPNTRPQNGPAVRTTAIWRPPTTF